LLSTSAMAHKKTVLIIDDELPIRKSLNAFFEDEGYRVFTAEDGDKGLDTWVPVEDYFSHIVFSHGICTACCTRLYPESSY